MALAVQPATHKRYKEALQAFEAWALEEEVKLDYDHNNGSTDTALADYIHVLYRRRPHGSHSKAAVTKAAVLHFHPRMKQALAESSRALVGWQRHWTKTGARSYRPLSYDMACLIALQLAKADQIRAGVGVLVAFAAALRKGELCALRPIHIRDEEESDAPVGWRRPGGTVATVVHVAQAKTGDHQDAFIRLPAVRTVLSKLVATTAMDSPLFPDSGTMGRLFKDACNDLGIGDLGFSMHSCRHGSATMLALSGASEAELMQHGRWTTAASVRRYKQCHQLLSLIEEVPADLRKAAKYAARHLVRLFDEALRAQH